MIRLTQGDQPAMSPVTALWLLAVPLFDTGAIILRRLSRGCSPFKPDREHIHHVFLLAGFSVTSTACILGGIALAAAIIGLSAFYLGVSDMIMFVGFLVAFLLYCSQMQTSWKKLRFFNRSIDRRKNLNKRREYEVKKKEIQNALSVDNQSDP
jgi:UDP-GlcNAc:undecaprenyl-phosphate GlcNAc-1-phosphate transferase